MTTSAKLGLELLASAAANQTLANTTFAQLDQLVQAGAIDKDLSTPPGSPSNGALYIVAAAATGAWSGKSGQLAYWLTSTGAWQFIVPRAGFAVRVLDELDGGGLPVIYGYTGAAWAQQASGGASLPVVQTPFTGDKTLALTDINTYNVSADATAQTVTLPAQATVAWTADAEIHVEQGGAGAVTVTGAVGVTINGVSAGSFVLSGQYAAATLKRKASDSWTLIYGALDPDLSALANNSTNGLWARTGAGTGSARTVTGTANKVTVTNGDGVSGNPTLTLPDTLTLVTPTVTGLLTVSGGQIAFPATQVPSANANTLDDYEEGTWTPVLTFAVPGDVAVTYTTQVGKYTKIGNAVTLEFNILTSTLTHTTSSGQIQISGQPFPPSVQTANSTLFWSGITKAGYSQVVMLVQTTVLTGRASGSAVAAAPVNATDVPSGGAGVRLQGSVTYLV